MFESMTVPTCKHTKDSQTESMCAEEKSEECVETVQTQKGCLPVGGELGRSHAAQKA